MSTFWGDAYRLHFGDDGECCDPTERLMDYSVWGSKIVWFTVVRDGHRTEGGAHGRAEGGDVVSDPERPRVVIEVGDRAEIALRAVMAETGMNKSTIANEAITLYAEQRALLLAGGRILTQQPGSRDWEELTWVRRG